MRKISTARACTGGHTGECLQQVAPVQPINWQDDSDAYGLVGDPTKTTNALLDIVDTLAPRIVGLCNRQSAGSCTTAAGGVPYAIPAGASDHPLGQDLVQPVQHHHDLHVLGVHVIGRKPV